jgi:hypothetical protein
MTMDFDVPVCKFSKKLAMNMFRYIFRGNKKYVRAESERGDGIVLLNENSRELQYY